MISIIVMAHGDLAQAMLKTAKDISGLDVTNVYTFSAACENDCSLICRQIENIFNDSADGALVLSDMFGGSGANVPLQAAKCRPGVNIITGLNLSMLMSALQYRANMNVDELAEKVEAEGKRAVINVSKTLQGKKECR